MSKELDLPFLALSQFSRAPERRRDPRPVLSDLQKFGSVTRDADTVAFIFREEVYRPEKKRLRGLAELILAKQRNGPLVRLSNSAMVMPRSASISSIEIPPCLSRDASPARIAVRSPSEIGSSSTGVALLFEVLCGFGHGYLTCFL
jgi:hypothetical protein